MQGGYSHPAFGGVTDIISAGVGKLENRFIELLVTDVGGMGLPRTTLEAINRGPDAARENFIRDFSGTFFNMFALGLFSRMMLKLFGDRVGALNPQGVNARAWIDAELMSRFGETYREVLAAAETAHGSFGVLDDRAELIHQLQTLFDRGAQVAGADHRIGLIEIVGADAQLEQAVEQVAQGLDRIVDSAQQNGLAAEGDAAVRETVATAARHLLALDLDLSGFYAEATGDPLLVRAGRGLAEGGSNDREACSEKTGSRARSVNEKDRRANAGRKGTTRAHRSSWSCRRR